MHYLLFFGWTCYDLYGFFIGPGQCPRDARRAEFETARPNRETAETAFDPHLRAHVELDTTK